MPKISDLIEKAEKDDVPYFAVEYFPPRTADGLTKLYERSARIAHQSEFSWLAFADLRSRCGDAAGSFSHKERVADFHS
jgi:hypothetical protein